jgi:hypothetical protein
MERRSIILWVKCSVEFKTDLFKLEGVQYPQRSQALGPRKAETEGEIIDLQLLYFDLI